MMVSSLAFGQIKVTAPNGDTKIGNTAVAPLGKLHVEGGNVIVEGGNVGIGQDSPKRPLHLTDGNGTGLPGLSGSTIALFHKSSDAGNNAFMSFIGSDSGTVGFNFGDSADEDVGYFQYRHHSNEIVIRTTANTSNALIFDNQGNMGLSAFSPTEKLHVNGNIFATGTITPSDRRLKNNLKQFTGGLDVVLKMNPVSYTYNGKAGIQSKKTHIGVVAQELNEIAPYLVDNYMHREFDEEGKNLTVEEKYMKISDSEIKYVLVNAIKEQQKMIENLQREINDLKDKSETGVGYTDPLEVELNINESPYLEQNVPNPFKGFTQIKYFLPESSKVNSATIEVYSESGSLIQVINKLTRGNNSIRLNNSNLTIGGIYFYCLKVDGVIIDRKKMVIAK